MKSRQHAYIFIRYSILSNSPVWALSKNNDINNYKTKLFSEDRLSFRESLFNNITLPSLVDQNKKAGLDSFKVVLITSTYLPEKHMQNLLDLTKKHDFLKVLAIDEKTSISDTISNFIEDDIAKTNMSVSYASIRLDDDDALHKQYLEKLKKFIDVSFSNHIISFPLGIEALYKNESEAITEGIKIDYPKIAAGIAHINYYDNERKKFIDKCKNIHQAGNHVKVDQKFPMILDYSITAYLRLVHDHQDGGITKGKKENKIDCGHILKDFAISESHVVS